jgi:hypothetical protein
VSKRIAIIVVALLACRCLAQEVGEKIVFHVTSVGSADATDYCTTGECSATRFTVEGYANLRGSSAVTAYVLDCVEVVTTKSPIHWTSVCAHVHASSDYDAKLYSQSVDLSPEEKGSSSADAPMRLLYSIKSEKEVSKQKR